MSSSRVRAVPPEAWVAMAVAALVLAPLLPRGFVLSYDMVFVPHQPLTPEIVGISSFAPRAVPSDLVVALMSRVVPADVVQKAVLVAVVVSAVMGAGRAWRCVAGRDAGRTVGALAAAIAYGWSPFVYERLVLGHWALLVTWAVLPWMVVAASRLAADDPARRRASVGTLLVAVAVCAAGSPTGGVLAAVFAVACCAGARRLGSAAFLLAGGVAANAPWLVPALLGTRTVLAQPDADGVAAFAARADTALGLWPSLLSGGGVWNSQVVPPGRESVVLAPLVLVGLLLAATGARRLWRRAPGAVRAVLVLAVLGVLVAGASASGLDGAVRAVVEHVPGGGLVRDSQKLVLPFVLVSALATGHAVVLLSGKLDRRPPAVALTAMAVLLPVITTPALAWGAAGRLEPVDYPSDWYAARQVVARDDVPGDVLVLPWSLYRRYPWNDERTLLTPAQRWFDRRVVTNDALRVAGLVVQGEDQRAADLQPVVDGMSTWSGAQVRTGLAEHGVRFVLVERRTGGTGVDEDALAGLERVLDGQDLALYAVPEPTPAAEQLPGVLPVAAGLAAGGAALGIGVILRLAHRTRRGAATVR